MTQTELWHKIYRDSKYESWDLRLEGLILIVYSVQNVICKRRVNKGHLSDAKMHPLLFTAAGLVLLNLVIISLE